MALKCAAPGRMKLTAWWPWEPNNDRKFTAAFPGWTTDLGNARTAQPAQAAAARDLLAFPGCRIGPGAPAGTFAAGALPERRVGFPAFRPPRRRYLGGPG